MTATTKGVRLSSEDVRLLEAIKRKLGCRSVSEVVRMGLRSIAREQGVTISSENGASTDSKAEKA
ncbi:MAG: ribbon-helix-helix protein, CopG family [Polyangiaceae bacterium]